jgi:hypothetical protein
LVANFGLFAEDSTKVVNPANMEISTYFCSGYLSDKGGDGYYTYSELGLKTVKRNYLVGGFIGVANVDCRFSGYKYTDLEFFLGLNYIGWGQLNDDYSYAFSVSPSLKHFSDYGKDGAGSGDEVWQRDWGTQVNAWINISDKLNRPFRNIKINFQYQTAFWSSREGTLIGQGYITDKVNFKATNRTYFKTQLETAIQKISFGEVAKIEPKIVFGYLRDGSSLKSMYESGLGIGISFTKEGRYYEALNIQYRARFGKEFINNDRLDLIEIGLDPQNLCRLLF